MPGELGREVERLAVGFQRLAIGIQDRSDLQGPLYRDHDGGDVRVALAAASGDPAGGGDRHRHHDDGEGRDRAGASIDARAGRASSRPSAYLPTIASYYSDSRRQHAVVSVQLPRRRSSITTRTSSGSPASIPIRRLRPGRRSRPPRASCANAGIALRHHHRLAGLDQYREFLRLPQPADRDARERHWRARCRIADQQSRRDRPSRRRWSSGRRRGCSTIAAAPTTPSAASTTANAAS